MTFFRKDVLSSIVIKDLFILSFFYPKLFSSQVINIYPKLLTSIMLN